MKNIIITKIMWKCAFKPQEEAEREEEIQAAEALILTAVRLPQVKARKDHFLSQGTLQMFLVASTAAFCGLKSFDQPTRSIAWAFFSCLSSAAGRPFLRPLPINSAHGAEKSSQCGLGTGRGGGVGPALGAAVAAEEQPQRRSFSPLIYFFRGSCQP